MKDRILVTGAAGFVGRQTLLPLIAMGFEVHAIARDERRAQPGVTWHQCDLFDSLATNELLAKVAPTHLLHAAWYTVHGKYWHSEENPRWLSASKALLQSFANNGGRAVVGIGSCAEYDWHSLRWLPWREETTCRPHTTYGQSKLALFEWASHFCAEREIAFTWATLFHLFGPFESESRIVPYLIRSALTGTVANCSSGRQIRDFLGVAACGKALAHLCRAKVGGRINVASGLGRSIQSVARTISSLLPRPLICNFGAKPDREDEPQYIVASCQKLRESGFRWRGNEFEECLESTIDWWRAAYGQPAAHI